jgi:hypothetical protein
VLTASRIKTPHTGRSIHVARAESLEAAFGARVPLALDPRLLLLPRGARRSYRVVPVLHRSSLRQVGRPCPIRIPAAAVVKARVQKDAVLR